MHNSESESDISWQLANSAIITTTTKQVNKYVKQVTIFEINAPGKVSVKSWSDDVRLKLQLI